LSGLGCPTPKHDTGLSHRTAIDVTGRKRAEEEREGLRQARVDLAHVSRVTTMRKPTTSLAFEDKPIVAAVTNTDMRGLARDQDDLEARRRGTTWNSLSAGPSLNGTVAACGLLATLRVAQAFYFTLPARMEPRE
jgi:hypothetical protein